MSAVGYANDLRYIASLAFDGVTITPTIKLNTLRGTPIWSVVGTTLRATLTGAFPTAKFLSFVAIPSIDDLSGTGIMTWGTERGSNNFCTLEFYSEGSIPAIFTLVNTTVIITVRP